MPIYPYCLTCSKTFDTVRGMQSHCSAKSHRRYRYVCEPCDAAYISLSALESHLNSGRHAYDLDDYSFNSSIRHFCNLCEKDFATSKALQQHKDSLAHRNRDYKCPFCSAKFKSPSGIAFHLESGCHKRIHRHQVTAAVHAMKIVPNIATKPLIEANSSVALTVIQSAGPTFILPGPFAFNGKSFQCHICYKTFRTLYSLSGHLNSPAHDEDEFRCPKCKREFQLISGFIQHLESRSCGLAKQKQIEGYFNDLSGQFSRLLKV